jgi:hypothetical protein
MLDLFFYFIFFCCEELFFLKKKKKKFSFEIVPSFQRRKGGLYLIITKLR